MQEITRKTTIQQAINFNPACADVLLSVGMHCLGCAMARGETIEEAAAVHGIEADELVKKLNDAK